MHKFSRHTATPPSPPQYVVAALSVLIPGALLLHHAAEPSLRDTVSSDMENIVHEMRSPLAQTVTSSDPSTGSANRALSTIADDEVLWLARCIYSETKRPVEQMLVAWVVRNRVVSQFHGKTSYREVVLEPYQFSAFNPGSTTRQNLLRLDRSSSAPGWQQALDIAEYVMGAHPSERPFPVMTRHFYSARSLSGKPMPHWARRMNPVPMTEHDIDNRRFRFFTGIM